MLSMYSFACGSMIYELLDTGLSNCLAVQTLNHGTNPLNYLLIRLTGGNPSDGGKLSGSTNGWIKDDTKNFFIYSKITNFSLKFIKQIVISKN